MHTGTDNCQDIVLFIVGGHGAIAAYSIYPFGSSATWSACGATVPLRHSLAHVGFINNEHNGLAGLDTGTSDSPFLQLLEQTFLYKGFAIDKGLWKLILGPLGYVLGQWF